MADIFTIKTEQDGTEYIHPTIFGLNEGALKGKDYSMAETICAVINKRFVQKTIPFNVAVNKKSGYFIINTEYDLNMINISYMIDDLAALRDNIYSIDCNCLKLKPQLQIRVILNEVKTEIKKEKFIKNIKPGTLKKLRELKKWDVMGMNKTLDKEFKFSTKFKNSIKGLIGKIACEVIPSDCKKKLKKAYKFSLVREEANIVLYIHNIISQTNDLYALNNLLKGWETKHKFEYNKVFLNFDLKKRLMKIVFVKSGRVYKKISHDSGDTIKATIPGKKNSKKRKKNKNVNDEDIFTRDGVKVHQRKRKKKYR